MSWFFSWRAPSTNGTRTIFGAGNATNNNNARTGDKANTDTHSVTVDGTAPTPNPMSFSSFPAETSTSSISMTATLASDGSTPVRYAFDHTNGAPGGNDRGFQTGRTFVDFGLAANTNYCYRTRARDNLSNTTAFSAISCAFTAANVPGAPTVDNPFATTLRVDVAPNGNPASTQFAIRNDTDGYFLNAAGGNNGSTPVWRTDAEWGSVTATGVGPSTDFRVKARNGDSVETAFGPIGSGPGPDPGLFLHGILPLLLDSEP